MADRIDPLFFEELSERDPIDVCRRAQCTYDDVEKYYSISVWGDEYRIYPHLCKLECLTEKSKGSFSYFNLFIVHYLLNAKAIEAVDQWISEKEIPTGITYFSGPHAIPVNLILARFKNDIQAFKNRCKELNGKPLEMADAAYVFEITPRVSFAVLYWYGDDEFPAESKFLFDKSIAEHFTLDVIFALAVGICERIVDKLDSKESP